MTSDHLNQRKPPPKCPKCGSYKIAIKLTGGFTVIGGLPFVCKDCGEVWGGAENVSASWD